MAQRLAASITLLTKLEASGVLNIIITILFNPKGSCVDSISILFSPKVSASIVLSEGA
jgi:hypothetical protein